MSVNNIGSKKVRIFFLRYTDTTNSALKRNFKSKHQLVNTTPHYVQGYVMSSTASTATTRRTTRKKKGPRFDIFKPQNYANLSALWKHRENLRRNLQRAQNKVALLEKSENKDNSENSERLVRAQKDVERNQRHLKHIDENKAHFYEHIKILMDLVLIESRLPPDGNNKEQIENLVMLFNKAIV